MAHLPTPHLPTPNPTQRPTMNPNEHNESDLVVPEPAPVPVQESASLTFKLRNVDPNGKFIKGHTFVYGCVKEYTSTHFTIEVTKFDAWSGKETTGSHRLARKCILYVSDATKLPWH